MKPDPQSPDSLSSALPDSRPTDTSEHSPEPSPSDPQKSDPVPLWQQVVNRENIVTVVLALALAMTLRTFVAEARWIPTDSMLPTLEQGDRLVVEKITYRFGEPQRGDIVVFNPPAALNFDGAYIKRVIGVPGDRIRVEANQGVYINGALLVEPYENERPQYSLNTLGDIGSTCSAIRPFKSSDSSEIVVPPDSFFMLGDNRNNSQDSHCWGFLPRANVIGRTVFRFWPITRIRAFGSYKYK